METNRLVNLVFIGASTGGTEIISELLKRIPPLNAALIIVQHMPKYINQHFCDNLNRSSLMKVRLAQKNDLLVPGQALVVPSEVHCRMMDHDWIQLFSGQKVNYVYPSADVLMESLPIRRPGQKIIGIILSGMGRDGARGMVHLKRLGGITAAQEESSCAVYGMPKEALELGGVDYILHPDEMPEFLIRTVGTLKIGKEVGEEFQ